MGRWITGSLGARRLSELRAKLDALESVPQRGGYSPWMSNPTLRVRAEAFSSLPAVLRPRSSAEVVSASSDLSTMHSFFTSAGEQGLEALQPSGSTTLKLDTSATETKQSSSVILQWALATVSSANESFCQRMSSLCQQIAPVSRIDGSRPRSQGRGFSSHLYRGGIFLEPPQLEFHTHEETAINLAHELGHQALFVLQSFDSIIVEKDLRKPTRSPIREVERPAIQTLHATVACLYMAEFLASFIEHRRNSAFLQNKYELMRSLVSQGISSLDTVELTPVGRAVIRDASIFASERSL